MLHIRFSPGIAADMSRPVFDLRCDAGLGDIQNVSAQTFTQEIARLEAKIDGLIGMCAAHSMSASTANFCCPYLKYDQ